MSGSRTLMQTPSTRDLVPRNRPGAQARRAASTDGPTPHIQTVKKTRGGEGQIPVQQAPSLLAKTGPQLSVSASRYFVALILSDVVEDIQENSFDPRSILPDTKSKKTLARLQEASSANKVSQFLFLSIQLNKVSSFPRFSPPPCNLQRSIA